MANVLDNATSLSVTTEAVIYTASGVIATVMGINIANVGVTEATITVKASGVTLIKDLVVPTESAFNPVLSKLVLADTDTITVESDIAVDVHVSVLEIS